MNKYPQTYEKFATYFQNEEDCYQYLAGIRWPDDYVCGRCGSKKYWYDKFGLYRCQECEYKGSVTAGTLFQDHKKSLLQWFHAMWHITENKHGTNALSLQKALGLGSYHTAWAWLHKFRQAMVRPNRDRLKGTVEVDEVFVGGKKAGKRGRGAEGKALVLVAVELVGNRLGRIRLTHIADASASTLEVALIDSIAPETTLQTDGWCGYRTSPLAELGYTHVVAEPRAIVGEDPLPHVNLVASLLKRWLLGVLQGGIKHSHLSYYLDEFTFRFNRRTSKARGLLFYRLMENAIQIGPKTESTFIGGRKPISA